MARTLSLGVLRRSSLQPADDTTFLAVDFLAGALAADFFGLVPSDLVLFPSRGGSAKRPVLRLTRMAKEIHDGGSEGVILLQVHQNLSEPAAIRPLAELAYGVCSDVGWRCKEEEQVYPRTRRKLPKLAHRSGRDGHSRMGPQVMARWPDAPIALRSIPSEHRVMSRHPGRVRLQVRFPRHGEKPR